MRTIEALLIFLRDSLEGTLGTLRFDSEVDFFSSSSFDSSFTKFLFTSNWGSYLTYLLFWIYSDFVIDRLIFFFYLRFGFNSI